MLQTVPYCPWLQLNGSACLYDRIRERNTGRKLLLFPRPLGLFLPGYKLNCFLGWICPAGQYLVSSHLCGQPGLPKPAPSFSCRLGWLMNVSFPLAVANIACFGALLMHRSGMWVRRMEGVGEKQVGLLRQRWTGWCSALRKLVCHRVLECTQKSSCFPKGRLSHLIPTEDISDMALAWIHYSFDSTLGLLGFIVSLSHWFYDQCCRKTIPESLYKPFPFFPFSGEEDCLTINTERELKKRDETELCSRLALGKGVWVGEGIFSG